MMKIRKCDITFVTLLCHKL